MENQRWMPVLEERGETMDEILMACGIGKLTWKICEGCSITVDEFGRSVRFIATEDE